MKISINLVDVCTKTTLCILFKLDTGFISCCIFLIYVYSMQGWTATTRHGVTRKWGTKRLKHKIYLEEPTVNMCLLILYLAI